MTAIWGPCLRSIPTSSLQRETVYLTFDDGPEPGFTEKVLEILEKYDAKATFFVIGEKAKAHQEIIRKTIAAGHTIGNHSCDHQTIRNFSTPNGMTRWLAESEELLVDLLGYQPIGYRPPAGVRTPLLHHGLNELGLPLVLWNHRFYDTSFALTQDRLQKSLMKMKSGDILLLHDRQRDAAKPVFLKSLEWMVSSLVEKGFALDCLQREQVYALDRGMRKSWQKVKTAY